MLEITLRKSAKQIITTLARIRGLVHPDDSVNHNAFSRRSGIPQPTVTRILNGPSDWRLSAETAEKLCAAFGITFAQARGDVPIKPGYRRKVLAPTNAELQLIRDLRSLPGPARKEVKTLIHIEKLLADRARRPSKRRLSRATSGTRQGSLRLRS